MNLFPHDESPNTITHLRYMRDVYGHEWEQCQAAVPAEQYMGAPGFDGENDYYGCWADRLPDSEFCAEHVANTLCAECNMFLPAAGVNGDWETLCAECLRVHEIGVAAAEAERKIREGTGTFYDLLGEDA